MVLADAFIQGILMGFLFALISLGLTIIFGVMDIVNFAHGEFLMLGMYTAYCLSISLGVDPLVTLPLCGAVGALLGLVSYYGLVRYLLRGPMVAQLLGTFGLMLFLRYLAVFLWGIDYRMIKKGLLVGKSLTVGPFHLDMTKVVCALLSLVAFTVVSWIIFKTRVGKALRATSINREAASYMGIRTERMNALAWAMGGITVGIAGGLLANFYYIYPMVGLLFVMIAFATVALGGFGSIKGAFFAGILIGILETVFPIIGHLLKTSIIGPHYKMTIVYLAYFLVVVFRPRGLFGWEQ